MTIEWEAVTALLGLFAVATAGLGFFVRSTVRFEIDKLRLELGQILANQSNQSTRMELLGARLGELQNWIEENDRRLRDIEQCCIAQHGKSVPS